jgi:8-oxo-dGTP diphosphatase
MNVRPSAIIILNESILTLRYCYGDTEVFALPGGNPDPGECLTEALARELDEELGVRAGNGFLRLRARARNQKGNAAYGFSN